jgi:membrane-bound lytic murein transglycosylase D
VKLRHLIATALLGLLAGSLLPVPAAHATEEPIPFPPELQADVDFWIRVYSEISTGEGFLHDERDLSLVYRKVKFESDVSPRARREAVDTEREKIEAMLRHLASGATDLNEEEQRLAALFGSKASVTRYAEAARNVRFQLGQSDRFREGLERSGTWEVHIARTFANLGLPAELAALPHVESSFNPAAYSKVGAAGLWQFMRGTGKRYLRVDDAVDERMDPFRATEAAAQLLDFNHRFLGSWPLALTAYNHGAAGMRRARDSMGTEDIATIVRGYKSPSFGFASRNFYVSFLAALTIDRNPDRYFKDLKRHPEAHFAEVELPAYVPMPALQKLLKIDKDKLASLNPAVRPAVWNGSRFLPKGYRLRLPEDARQWTAQRLSTELGATNLYVGQPRLSKGKLVAANLTKADAAQANTTKADAKTATAEAVTEALTDRRAEERVATQRQSAVEPVTASEAQEDGPSLVPGGAVAQAADAVDYTISTDDSIRVAAEETIGHYADWLGLSASRLRVLNHLRGRSAVIMGRSFKLDFSRVSREQFEEKRRAYHDTLQANFFAGHRITGTQVYVTRRGDSLWNITLRNGGLPTWLVLHYNPDVDFRALRAGVEIVIPKVEAVPAA